MQHVSSHIPFFTRSCFYAHPRPRLRIRLKLASPSRIDNARQFSTTPPIHYATHNTTATSSLLSQTLDQRDRSARSAQGDSVGPFMLGGVGFSQRPVKESDLKKWSELDTKGKVKRTATRTSNLTVIAFGAGFTALLIYALSSELFARNSPTVLYGQACERIKASEKISQHLRAPLVFHNNPPSAHRPRHRNRHVSSHLAVDSAGREHLLLNFYIRGSSNSGSAMFIEDEDENLVLRVVGRGWRRLQALQETTWGEAAEWSREAARRAKDRARILFLYLTGEPASSSGPGQSGSLLGHVGSSHRETRIGRSQLPSDVNKGGGGVWGSIVGLFSGLGKGMKGGSSASALSNGDADDGRGEVYEEGEVHADLVKDENGNFVWRYLIVDMPSSRVRNPRRVFIERREDVRESEGVMRWY